MVRLNLFTPWASVPHLRKLEGFLLLRYLVVRLVGWLVGWWSLDTSSQRCSSHRGQRWTTSLFQILERTIRLWKYQLTVGYWLSLTIFPTDSIWCEACMDCLPWYMPAQFWLTGKSCMPHIVPRRDKCERDQLTYCFAIYASNGNLRLLGRLRFVIYWPKTVQFRKVHTNMQCFFLLSFKNICNKSTRITMVIHTIICIMVTCRAPLLVKIVIIKITKSWSTSNHHQSS